MQSLQLFKTFLILGFIAFTFSSCNKEEKKEGTKVSGFDAEILNLSDSTISLSSYITPINKIKGKPADFVISIDVDSNGIFATPIHVTEGYYIFEYDRNKTKYFIQVGKKLSLDFDATKPYEKPDYSGKLKYESRYLFDRHLAQSNFRANENKYFEYTEKEFVEVVELMRGKMDTMLVMYIANHPTGSEYFMRQESLTNHYFMASYLEAYPVKRWSENNDIEPISDSYYTKLNHLNLNDSNAFDNPEFFEYIQNYIWNRAGAPSNEANVIAQIKMVNEQFEIESYQDYLRFKSAKEVALWNDTESRAHMLDTLIGLINDQGIQRFLVQNITSDTTSISQIENKSTEIE